MYRKRFALRGHPLPRDAQGKTFFTQTDGYRRLRRGFDILLEDRGVGVITGAAGLGKTASLRNICNALPSPDHRIIYLCDTAVAPLDLYRMLAGELGVRPSHRRSQLWADIKAAMMHLVDEQGTMPVIILDEAQHLSDRFLVDLSGFLNFAFDSRDLFPLWLVGLPRLAAHLRMQQHAALAMRVGVHVHLEAFCRKDFYAFVDHGLKAVGANEKLLSDAALEMLYRTSHGVPRMVSKLLRAALREAHEREQAFVDEPAIETAIELMGLAIVGKR